MRRARLLKLLALSCLLTGCMVGPNYQAPKVSAPPQFRGPDAATQQSSLADLPWWEVFHDKTLQELVQMALANNYDVRVAATRVEQARQLAAQARALQFPSVGYQAGLSAGKNEALGTPVETSGATAASLGLIVQSAWELDLWGRVRHLKENALAQYLASEQVRRGVLLLLVSQVAQSYFELLELDHRLEIARRTVSSFEGSLGIFRDRLNAGAASRLETSRAEAALATVTAYVPELERQIALKENEISVLLGANPASVSHPGKLLDESVPPDVPAGLPSALLERRPDVLQAELAVRAANASIGVAQADYFPRIGLTTLLGRLSVPLEQFTAGSANLWSVAGTAAGPIYEGGALRARKRQAVAAWEQSRLQYEQTVLNAFRDVSNALITRQKLEAIREQQALAVKAYEDAVTVSLQRYTYGKSSYYEVLEAQQQLFPAENALSQTELARRTVIVQLYQALGGGWNLKSPTEWKGPQPATPPPAPSQARPNSAQFTVHPVSEI